MTALWYPTPEQCFAVMVGTLGLGGLIFFAEGIYRQSYLMTISGWFAAAIAVVIGTVWIALGHCPICAENAVVSSYFGASATCYRCAENVRVKPMIVSELKFRDRQLVHGR